LFLQSLTMTAQDELAFIFCWPRAAIELQEP
jgi:hypothetical protein